MLILRQQTEAPFSAAKCSTVHVRRGRERIMQLRQLLFKMPRKRQKSGRLGGKCFWRWRVWVNVRMIPR